MIDTRILKCAALLSLCPGATLAYCGEPSFSGYGPSFHGSAPAAPLTYQKPGVPFCLSSYRYTGEHDCGQWELDRYFQEVNDYIGDLEDYVAEANEFAADVRAFAEEAIAFANQASVYAGEAYEFAVCAAEEIGGQHR